MTEKQERISEIKKKLYEELQKEDSDNDVVLSLSQELAKLDTNNVRFSIDAGVIDRLGDELVARQETAVSELVKNSYDADAQEVILSFVDTDEIGGTLNIKDDGDGMTREELIDGFMRISSTGKIHNPYSRKFNRKRAGQKGIGRFAVQRLGNKLTIITQVESYDFALKLTINWKSYQRDKDLSSITNSLESIPKIREKGTTLIIGGLKDKWSTSAIQRIYRYVNDIIQPFPISKKNEEIESKRIEDTNDPGFKTKFIKTAGKETITVADDSIMVYDHAIAVIEGFVDDNGQGEYKVRSSKLGINESGKVGSDPDDLSAPFNNLKEIWFRAYYFIYEKDVIPSLHLSSIQKMARTSGGIRLYRNGFRVLPYGEAGNDWLTLDKSSRQRSLLPAHANLNFFGFVELSDENMVFNETSSREGLSENDAFIDLQNFVYRAIISGVLKVAEVRGIKIKSGQTRDEDGEWEKIDFRIKNIAHTLEQLDKELENDSGTIEAKKRRKQKIKKVKAQLEELEEVQKIEQQRTIKERSMLRVLSSVGLTVGQFIHEIKYYLDNIQSDIRFLVTGLQEQKELLERIEILAKNFSSFKTYTSYFDNVISQNIIRELQPLNLSHVITPFINSITADALKSGIEFVPPIIGNPYLYTRPMHPSEWSSILFNFYTNSKKAIKRTGDFGKILIECGSSDEMLFLEFSDTGDGISKENEEKVFDEFYTTTSPNDFAGLNQSTEILGTGLGLKIVRDIVHSYKGNVFVVSPKAEYSTCIRVELPRASDKELKDYGL
ncbi:MAG: sensor histidine kinase [Cytophagales bacterium]